MEGFAIAGGRHLVPAPPLDEIRLGFREEYVRLPDGCKALREPAEYPVELSEGLSGLYAQLRAEAQRPPPAP